MLTPIWYSCYVMIERQPDFEDEKIRLWKTRAGDQEGGEFEGDPTLLSLDVEQEEIFESRTYRFQRGPEAFHYLLDLVTSRRPKLGFSPQQVVQAAAELMEVTVFKFLAKRRKEDGLITSLLVASAPNSRSRLSRQDWVEEAEYREAVQGFEESFLPEGVLAQPLVVTLEEWQGYSQEGPFLELGPVE